MLSFLIEYKNKRGLKVERMIVEEENLFSLYYMFE
jgi:hypothetical protein